MVAVVEIANLQRPRKKITVEYCWGNMALLFGKHVRPRKEKYRTHVYADYAVCNLFIHVI